MKVNNFILRPLIALVVWNDFCHYVKNIPRETDVRFHELRMKTGLTIEELSDELGYSPRQVYRWDNGETAPADRYEDNGHSECCRCFR